VILWLVLAVLMALALWFLVRPLSRTGGAPERGAAYDIEVYRDQLAEIGRDQERGALDEAEAEAARLEVQRRMLAADARPESAASTKPVSSRFVLIVALAVPLAAGSLYVGLGRPDLVGAEPPAASTRRGPSAEDIRNARNMTPEQRAKMIRGMVEGLAARLKATPDDLAGWLRLGRAYTVLGDHAKAAEAYGRAAALAPKDVRVQSLHAMALLSGRPKDRPIPPALRKKLLGLLDLDPRHPLGLYYAGVFAVEAGRPDAAIGHWEKLLAVIPKDSPLRKRIEGQIAALKARKAAPKAPSPETPKKP
jgi:cytochrome c-type biogenesis protein CcmH